MRKNPLTNKSLLFLQLNIGIQSFLKVQKKRNKLKLLKIGAKEY